MSIDPQQADAGTTATPTSKSLRSLMTDSRSLRTQADRLGGVDRVLDTIEDHWLDVDGRRAHVELHRARSPRATIVFHPGSGSYARFYALAGARFAAGGYHWLAIDRWGHGYSPGERGDCTIEEALSLTACAIDWAQRQLGGPVILLGSSLGGLITGFSVASGARPDLAISHNFIWPGKLVTFRLRARWIRRFRRQPYRLPDLANGFKSITEDPVLADYLKAAADPRAAWTLTPRAVASLFGFHLRAQAPTTPLLVISGDRDRIIPGWASRVFTRFSGIRQTGYTAIAGAGHMLFHDHLEETFAALDAAITDALENRC